MARFPLGVLLAALLALASGCAPSWTIVGAPAGMTRQEMARIMAICQASGPAAGPTPNLGATYMQQANRDASFRLCLEAHGIETADK
jgi:hypothetical protein